MQRADGFDIQRSSLFEQSLHLGAILAHDVQVIAAGFAGPIRFFVKLCHSAKTAKAIGGEEHLLAALVADHDLRPMHHRCKDEGQRVAAQAEALAILYHHAALRGNGICAKELLHILEGLGVAHHLHLRVERSQLCHICTMVRLHVRNHQIGGLALPQCLGQIGQPRLGSAGIHRIQDGGLFVQDHIGIIADTGGYRILALEQVDGGIVHPYTKDGFADFFHAHTVQTPFLFILCRQMANISDNDS